MSALRMLSVLCAVMALAGVGCLRPAWSADLPTWKMDELKTLAEGGWGPAAKDGDRPYRAALAGRRASWTVPIWWGKTMRAPEGTVYVLRVSYKDTINQPAVFYSHGGFTDYWGLGEVHRFGGAGDGQWKTADVPVSWDLVCRKNVPQSGPSDLTEFAIEAKGDLPVESITVTPAGPSAAEKYFAETRAWIARAQADKAKSASRGRRQEPVLPEAMKDKPLVAYVRSYLVPLMQNDAPQKGEAGGPMKLRMARNEYETGAFGVYANAKDLKNVTFSVGELKGQGGALACAVDCRTAEYSAVQGGGSGSYRMFPQRMWPAYPVDIASGQSHWFWVTVRTLGGKTQAGKYAGTVTIKADGFSAELPVEVEVVPVMLLTMQEAKLELGACGFATLQELKTLAENNHTGMDIWFGGTQPQMKADKDKKLTLDYYYMDDWMAYAVKCGMTHMMWFMGGDPYGFPDTVNLERDLYRSQPGENAALRREFIDKTSKNPDKVIPELRGLYVDFVRQTAEHAKKKGWPGRIIIHPFDEPAKWVQSSKWDNPFHPVIGTGAWIKGHFQDACALIRQGAKGHENILTGGDIHHAEPGIVFVKDIDVFCTNAIHEDLKLGDKVRAAGTEFWQYSGCGDSSPAHQGRFAFGFYFGAFDARGYLIWAYDAMGRFDTSEGRNWGFGWYTPFGTVYGSYMIGVREGCDDRRWMETYKKTVGPASAKALLEEIGQQAIAQRTGGGRDTVTDFYAEMERHERMDQWRNQIIEAVLRAGRPGK